MAKMWKVLGASGWILCPADTILELIAHGCCTKTFRIKQNTITVNGREIVAGMDKPLENGEYYYCIDINLGDYYSVGQWNDHRLDKLWLSRGIIHNTKENAIAHAKAMLGIDPNSPNED